MMIKNNIKNQVNKIKKMNFFNFVNLAVVALLGLGSAFQALADMDENSRNLLIEKLQKVQLGLAAQDPSYVTVTLRLADLYSERARVASVKELEQGCTVCESGKSDRRKALGLYQSVQKSASTASLPKIMIQIGHLHQMLGEESQAIAYYHKIIESAKTQPHLASAENEALLSLAELYFKKRDFAEAKKYYSQLASRETSPNQGLAAYKVAWCDFNLGSIDLSIQEIENVLKNPRLLSRGKSNQIDPQFHEEVARDYVTFLGRKVITEKDIQNVLTLSPSSQQVNFGSMLAQDQERLGHKKESLMVWNQVISKISEPDQKLLATISIAQLQFDLGALEDSQESDKKSLQLAGAMADCQSTNCQEAHQRQKKYLVLWNQTAKKNIPENLVRAYEDYVAVYPKDLEVILWAQEAAIQRSDLTRALKFNESALALVLAQKTENEKNKPAVLESLLLSRIEYAEKSKDLNLLKSAQDRYINESLQKTKFHEVLYQKAHTIYDQAQYQESSVLLHALVQDKAAPAVLRKQAADLSLDALVLLKDEKQLESWSAEYVTQFPQQAAEFKQIYSKVVLNKAASLAEKDPAQSLQVLSGFDLSMASEEDQIKILKNKIILAEKLHKIVEAQNLTDELLLKKNLSEADQKFAIERKSYFAELRLDFETSLKTLEKLKVKSTDQTLKLALFSEMLGGVGSQKYYADFLKQSQDSEMNQAVASEMIRKSQNPKADFEKYRIYLEKNPEALSLLAAMIYAKTKDAAFLKKELAQPKMKGTSGFKILARAGYLDQFSVLKKKISGHQLQTQNQAALAKSIKARAALLTEAETMANKSIEMADWTSQVVSLQLVASESSRFYQDLLSAPVPAGLNAEDEQQYLSLLSQQAAPYQIKSTQAQAKVDEFWKNPKWKEALTSSSENADLKFFVDQEFAALDSVAPESEKEFFKNQNQVASVPQTAPQSLFADLEKAKSQVRQNPWDRSALENLIGLEKKTKNPGMVQYLEARLKVVAQEGVQ